MSFSLHVATDICQEKVNVEIPFNSKPGIDEFRMVCEEVFSNELTHMRNKSSIDVRNINNVFSIGRIQIYDDDACQWVDLVSAVQLHPFDQMYVFPMDLNHICQQRRELPPPSRVSLPSLQQQHANIQDHSVTHQSQHHKSNYNNHDTMSGTLINLSAEEKLRKVFEQLDSRHKGLITPSELVDSFTRHKIMFSHATVNQMFVAVNNRTPHWDYNDFISWTKMYPVSFNAFYQRVFLNENEQQMIEAKKAKMTHIQTLEERVVELRNQLLQSEAMLHSDRDGLRQMEEDLRALRDGRARDEEEEQVVLDKEVSVQHQRAQLRREENDFEIMAQRKGLLAGPGIGVSRRQNESAVENRY